MRRWIWLLGGGVAGAALLMGVLSRTPAVQDAVFARGLAARMEPAGTGLLEPDALRVLLCGTASPFPHPTRARPCTAVFAAGRFYVVDTGTGSWNNLALWGIPAERIGGVLLTHFHSDHIGELGEFDLQTWVAGRPEPLSVFGPRGVERVVAGFEAAYALDTEYRIAHHGADFLPAERGRMRARPLDPIPAEGLAPVLEREGLVVTVFRVDHAPVSPAVGYRFDYRGRSVVVSGDTARSAGVAAAARGADVLVHEAQANHMVATIRDVARAAGRERVAHVMEDIPDYHTTPVEAAALANEAQVGLLVLTHLTPPPANGLLVNLFTRGVREARDGDWLLGDDGLLIELPADSKAIETRRLR